MNFRCVSSARFCRWSVALKAIQCLAFCCFIHNCYDIQGLLRKMPRSYITMGRFALLGIEGHGLLFQVLSLPFWINDFGGTWRDLEKGWCATCQGSATPFMKPIQECFIDRSLEPYFHAKNSAFHFYLSLSFIPF